MAILCLCWGWWPYSAERAFYWCGHTLQVPKQSNCIVYACGFDGRKRCTFVCAVSMLSSRANGLTVDGRTHPRPARYLYARLGCGYCRVLLNKADTIDTQQLMRVYGALMWSLGKVMQTPEVCRVYIGSFWEAPLSNSENRFLLDVSGYTTRAP